MREAPSVPERNGPVRVVFVCVENSCRSQMAEAFARALAGDRVEAHSAGSRPSGRVDPRAVAFMAELGLDLSSHRSTSVENLPDADYDAVVMVGCEDACPSVAARRRLEWEIPDPKDLPPEAFRRVRDLIRDRVAGLLGELTGIPGSEAGRGGRDDPAREDG